MNYIISGDTIIAQTPGRPDTTLQIPGLADASPPVPPAVIGDSLYAIMQYDHPRRNGISLFRVPLPLRADAPPEEVWRCQDDEGLFGILDALWFDGGVLLIGEITDADGEALLGNGFQARALDGTLLWKLRGTALPDTAWLDRINRVGADTLIAQCTKAGGQRIHLTARWPDPAQPPAQWQRSPALDAIEDILPEEHLCVRFVSEREAYWVQDTSDDGAEICHATCTHGAWHARRLHRVPGRPADLRLAAEMWVTLWDEDASCLVCFTQASTEVRHRVPVSGMVQPDVYGA